MYIHRLDTKDFLNTNFQKVPESVWGRKHDRVYSTFLGFRDFHIYVAHKPPNWTNQGILGSCPNELLFAQKKSPDMILSEKLRKAGISNYIYKMT